MLHRFINLAEMNGVSFSNLFPPVLSFSNKPCPLGNKFRDRFLFMLRGGLTSETNNYNVASVFSEV